MKIIKPSEPLPPRSVVGVIYGEPGTGKTSLAMRVQNRPSLLIDFDNGVGRAVHRIPVVVPDNWLEVWTWCNSEAIKEYREGVLIIDTGKAMLDDFMTEQIVKNNPKDAKVGGGLSIQGYGTLKDLFARFLGVLRKNKIDIIIVCHAKEEKKGKTDINRATPEMTGGSLGVMVGRADFIGYMYMVDDRRVLNFNPSDTHLGKNTGNMQPVYIPNHNDPEYKNVMGQIIETVRGKLSEETEEMRIAGSKVAEFEGLLTECTSFEDLYSLVNQGLLVPVEGAGDAYIITIHKLFTDAVVACIKAEPQELLTAARANAYIETFNKIGVDLGNVFNENYLRAMKKALIEAANAFTIEFDLNRKVFRYVSEMEAEKAGTTQPEHTDGKQNTQPAKPEKAGTSKASKQQTALTNTGGALFGKGN